MDPGHSGLGQGPHHHHHHPSGGHSCGHSGLGQGPHHHHHHHPGGDSHQQPQDLSFSEANRQYFNESAAKYDLQPMIIDITRGIVDAILRTIKFDEESTTVMEYACGTGLVSQGLAPYSKTIVGVDISEAMVEYFNQRVSNQGIPFEEMKAVCAELKGEEEELDGQKFDVVVCSQSYHHFASIRSVTRILASFLKPGGTLLVIDMLKDKSMMTHTIHPMNVQQVVAHRGGFEEEEIRTVFEEVGLKDVEIEVAYTVKDKYNLFIAKGMRPASS